MRRVLVALVAVLLLTGCGAMTTSDDCPTCGDRCWEGAKQCTTCRKKHSCPARADTQDVMEEPDAMEEPAPELPLA